MAATQSAVTASIVIYGAWTRHAEELVTLLAHQCDTVYVVDNTVPALLDDAYVGSLPTNVRYLPQPDNPGYGAGHNRAFRLVEVNADGLHIIMNPDVAIEDDFVERIRRWFDDPFVGLVMPRVRYPNGQPQRLARLLPGPLDVARRIAKPYLRLADGRYELTHLDWSAANRVPIVSGCCMAVRHGVLRAVGGFDTSFFMYFEDYDLSRRVASHHVVLTVPDPVVVHEYAATSRRSVRLLTHHVRSAVHYFNKWGWFWDPQRRRLNSDVGPYSGTQLPS